MEKIILTISDDFNAESVAEEILHQFAEEGYDTQDIDIYREKQTLSIESETILFDEQFVAILLDTTDGYRSSYSLD